MAKRAPAPEAAGKSGESEVQAELERWRWGVHSGQRHDIGTDLYVVLRDERGFDLGVMIGVQVKTGPKWFKRPEKDANGEVVGWWFADSDGEHFDGWLHHVLQHLLVLRDQSTDTSYWVHVEQEAVRSTGKGAKILVPRGQVLDEPHRRTITDIALSPRPVPAWSGSAWVGAPHLAAADRLRHALLVPRLIAPHQNNAPPSVNGMEALAMQVLLRPEMDHMLAQEGRGQGGLWRGLDLGAARSSASWEWRAAAALYRWFFEGAIDDVAALTESAATPAEVAAATVIAVMVDIEIGRVDDALDRLKRALEGDDHGQVDFALLQGQKARVLLETGHREEAFELAGEAMRIAALAPHDVTASMIAGAAATTAFHAAGWLSGDVAALIRESDNPGAWWAGQLKLYGLSDHLSNEFRVSTGGSPKHSGGVDVARRRLRSAATIVSMSGDHRSWQTASSQLARHMLVNPTDGERDTREAQLTTLRRSGDQEAVTTAVADMIAHGPIEEVQCAASSINPRTSTRTTAGADLTFLIGAADVLESTSAEDLASWVQETIDDPSSYVERTQPEFTVLPQLAQLLKELLPSMGASARDGALSWLVALPSVTDELFADALEMLIATVPDDWWPASCVEQAARRAGDAGLLSDAFRRVAAIGGDEALQLALKELNGGRISALLAVKDFTRMSPDDVAAVAVRLADAVRAEIDDAQAGGFKQTLVDAPRELVLLSYQRPEAARWDELTAFLAEPRVFAGRLEQTLRLLIAIGVKLPADARAQLLPAVESIGDRDNVPTRFYHGPNYRLLAREAAMSLADASRQSAVARGLLLQGRAGAQSAANLIGRFRLTRLTDALLPMLSSDDADSQTAAARALSVFVATGELDSTVTTRIQALVETGGRRIAEAVADGLASVDESGVPHSGVARFV